MSSLDQGVPRVTNEPNMHILVCGMKRVPGEKPLFCTEKRQMPLPSKPEYTLPEPMVPIQAKVYLSRSKYLSRPKYSIPLQVRVPLQVRGHTPGQSISLQARVSLLVRLYRSLNWSNFRLVIKTWQILTIFCDKRVTVWVLDVVVSEHFDF